MGRLEERIQPHCRQNTPDAAENPIATKTKVRKAATSEEEKEACTMAMIVCQSRSAAKNRDWSPRCHFSCCELPHFSGINCFFKTPYLKDVYQVGEFDAAVVGCPLMVAALTVVVQGSVHRAFDESRPSALCSITIKRLIYASNDVV